MHLILGFNLQLSDKQACETGNCIFICLRNISIDLARTLRIFLLLKRNSTVPSTLVCSTVAEMAMAIIWCSMEIVHIIWTTISHFDVCWPETAVTTPVKTHRPVHLTVCYCRVTTINPGGSIRVTPVGGWTWSWHSCASRPFNAEPSRADTTVTLIIGNAISNLPVTTVETPTLLTFWNTQKR